MTPGRVGAVCAVAALALLGAALIAGGARARHERRAPVEAQAATAQGPPSAAAESQTAHGGRPNILWILWDTVRADHLGPYGYERPTSPFLNDWARDARVFTDCISPGNPTVPAHASLFTGLLPSEHGADNERAWLPDSAVTLAELLVAAGYRTYLFSENPHIARPANFQQGFELCEHPWSPQYYEDALRITREKVAPDDRSTELPQRLAGGRLNDWNIKAAGELAERGVRKFLATTRADEPYFVFVNYMEAHRPLIPPRRFRERFMSAERVSASYGVDRTWLPLWRYCFGLREYSADELALTRDTYDAAIAELDELFRSLLDGLRSDGRLENTLIVVCADHGEHLGEHHLLDHQFSLYEPLLRVPLIVHYPPRFAPGRDDHPVLSFDLFPTILELTGVAQPASGRGSARSLLAPLPRRARLAGYPAPLLDALAQVQRAQPGFDPRPWQRTLRAYYEESWKYIWASDGRHELYDLSRDPGETHNLVRERVDDARRLHDALRQYVKALHPPLDAGGGAPPRDEQQRKFLESLGYAGESADVPVDRQAEVGPFVVPAAPGARPSSQPSSRPASRPTSRPSASGPTRP